MLISAYRIILIAYQLQLPNKQHYTAIESSSELNKMLHDLDIYVNEYWLYDRRIKGHWQFKKQSDPKQTHISGSEHTHKHIHTQIESLFRLWINKLVWRIKGEAFPVALKVGCLSFIVEQFSHEWGQSNSTAHRVLVLHVIKTRFDFPYIL